jgi:tRNA pseudouridine55 synthase
VTRDAGHGGPERRRPARRAVSGIVLLDKPAGLSSNRALQRVRHALRAAKAGHAGTLDPMATGMLPLCFGHATKTCGRILSGNKAYRACVRLGTATESGDALGREIARAEVPDFDAADVERVLAGLRGSIEQTPPMVSALKFRGERLYELARRGESVPRAARRIEVHRLELVSVGHEGIELEVECSKGTYVRVLGEDIAARLDTLGHLSALRRLWVAPFESEAMVNLDEITAWEAAGAHLEPRPPWLLPVERALAGLPRVDLDIADATAIRHGRSTAPASTGLASGATVCGYDAAGTLLGLLTVGPDRRLRVLRLLADAEPDTSPT